MCTVGFQSVCVYTEYIFRVRTVGCVRDRYTCVPVTFGAGNGSNRHFCFSQVGLNKTAWVNEINTPRWSERGWMTDIKEMDRDTFWTAVLNHALRMRSMSAALLCQRGFIYQCFMQHAVLCHRCLISHFIKFQLQVLLSVANYWGTPSNYQMVLSDKSFN